MLDTAQNDTDINSSISSFTDLMDSVCVPLFGRQPNENYQFDQNDNAHSQNHTNFDQTCNNKRSIFYKNLNIYRKNKNEINRQTMIHARTEYKNTVRKFNLAQNRLKTSKLLHAKLKKAKE